MRVRYYYRQQTTSCSACSAFFLCLQNLSKPEDSRAERDVILSGSRKVWSKPMTLTQDLWFWKSEQKDLGENDSGVGHGVAWVQPQSPLLMEEVKLVKPYGLGGVGRVAHYHFSFTCRESDCNRFGSDCAIAPQLRHQRTTQ
jgi:hypothetical protein